MIETLPKPNYSEHLSPAIREALDNYQIPTPENYALLPVDEAFDWATIIREICDIHNLPYGTEICRIAFLSTRNSDADVELLNALDTLAHEKAKDMPGFLYYYKGAPDEQGNCISFCLWKSEEEAFASAAQEDHKKAAALAKIMYSPYILHGSSVWLDLSPAGYGFTPPEFHSYPAGQTQLAENA